MPTQTVNSGMDIIDAAQNAVIEAATDMEEIMEANTAVAHAEHEIFYLSAEFWVAAAFVITVLLLSRPIYKAVKTLITKRIDGIRQRLDDAEKLQTDAEKLLASYERKFRNAKKEADNILKKSQTEIDYLRKATLSRMEQDMAQKEKDVAEKLENAKLSAVQEISNLASSLSIKTVHALLKAKLNTKEQDRLIENSIKNLDKVI